MGNITGILSNNFAHAQAVSSRPNCLGLEKEAICMCDTASVLVMNDIVVRCDLIIEAIYYK